MGHVMHIISGQKFTFIVIKTASGTIKTVGHVVQISDAKIKRAVKGSDSRDGIEDLGGSNIIWTSKLVINNNRRIRYISANRNILKDYRDATALQQA